MTTLDELVVRIKADASQLERELRRANQTAKQQTSGIATSVNQMKSSFAGAALNIAGLGTAIGGLSLVSLAKQAIQVADQMQNLSERTGISASFFSAMQVEIENSGGSLDGFAQSVMFMSNVIGEAAQGNKQAAQSFSDLGVNLEALRAMNPQEQFLTLAQAISELGTEAERTEAARDVFGRGVAGMLPLIQQGGDALRQMADSAIEAGNALSDEQIQRIDNFGDAIGRMATTIRNEGVGAFADFLLYLDKIDAQLARYQRRNGADMSGKNRAGASGAGWGAIGNPNADAQKTAEQEERDRLRSKWTELGYATEIKYGDAGVNLEEEYIKKYGAPSNKPRITSSASTGKSSGGSSSANKAQTEEQKRMNDMRAEASRLIDKNRTDQERYNISIASAKELLDAGLITQQQYKKEAERLGDVLKETGDSGTVSAKIIKDSFADALESAIFDFENFGDAAGSILEGVARNLLRAQIIDPLSSALNTAMDKGSVGDFFGGFFADGGSPPVGKASVVGERGPELFVPRSAGTIIPNGGFGGGSNVTINITNNTGSQVSARQSSSGNGTSIDISLDQAIASHMARPGSMTNQALSAYSARALTRR